MTQGRAHQTSLSTLGRWSPTLAGVRPLRVIGLSVLLLLGIAGLTLWRLWPPIPVDLTGRAERVRLLEVAEERARRGWGLEPCPGYAMAGLLRHFAVASGVGVSSPEIAVFIAPSWQPMRMVLINRVGSHAFRLREGASGPSVFGLRYPFALDGTPRFMERQLLDRAAAGDAEATRHLIMLTESRYWSRYPEAGERLDPDSFEPVAHDPLPMPDAEALIDTLRRHVVFASSPERRVFNGVSYVFVTRDGHCAFGSNPDPETPAGAIGRMVDHAANGLLSPEVVREQVAIIEAFDGARAPDWRDQLAALWAGVVGSEPVGEDQ
jgi:hypothetical protein